MALAAIGYILYTFRDFMKCLFFVSMTIEELGSFMEVTMDILKKCVWNKNWIVGKYSMIKNSAGNIKLSREEDTFGLSTGFYVGTYKRIPFLAIVTDNVLNGFGDWVPRHPGITFIMFRWHQKHLWELLKEIRLEEKPTDNFVTGFNTETINGRSRSGFKSLFLPEGIGEEIENYVKWFVTPEGEEWYRKMNQPYKLSILLYGSVGTGKTAIARAISDVTQRSLTHVRLVTAQENRDISHETVCYIAGSRNDVILFDEIDKLFSDNVQGSKVDPGTLLSLLNGDLLDGQIIVLTANDLNLIPEDFRESLLRPRRIDKKYELKGITEYQKKAACKFYKIQYSEKVQKMQSMAEVMEHIMSVSKIKLDKKAGVRIACKSKQSVKNDNMVAAQR